MRAVIVLAVIALGACGAAGKGVRDSVVRCATGSAPALVEQFGPTADAAIREATRDDGSIDTEALKRAASRYTWDVAGCVLADAVARALAVGQPMGLLAAPAGPKPEQLRAAWEAVRAEQLGGRRFELVGGTVM